MNRLLVDTHAVIWWLADDAALTPPAHELLSDPANTPFVSVASIWEMAIKRSRGKLQVADHLPDLIVAEGFELLPVDPHDAWSVAELPHHHSDPFDRMLIAQATNRGIPIITGDRAFSEYDVAIRW